MAFYYYYYNCHQEEASTAWRDAPFPPPSFAAPPIYSRRRRPRLTCDGAVGELPLLLCHTQHVLLDGIPGEQAQHQHLGAGGGPGGGGAGQIEEGEQVQHQGTWDLGGGR